MRAIDLIFSKPRTWPLGLRRAYVLTLPVAMPLLFLLRAALCLVWVALIAVGIVCETVAGLWTEQKSRSRAA